MSLARCLAGLVVLALVAGPLRADDPKPSSAAHLVPIEADVLIEIHKPKVLVETLRNLQTLQAAYKLPFFKEQLGGTAARRALQLLAYFEKKLGKKWPDALEQLAGNGAALGIKFGNNAPAILVLYGKDEKTTATFVKELLTVAEGELARQESKEKVKKDKYNDIPVAAIGKDAFLGTPGKFLVLTNRKEALKRALDLFSGKEKKSHGTNPHVIASRKLLPKDPLVNVYLNMEPIQKSDDGKQLYTTPRDNFLNTVLFGEYLDILGRTPYLAAALTKTKDEIALTIRAPKGRKGMNEGDLGLHLNPADKIGSLPLLEPKGAIYSVAFYLDLGKIWTDRAKLFTKPNTMGLENFDKTSGRFLLGTKFSTLLQMTDPRHRFVVVNRAKNEYTIEPKVKFPSFAFVPGVKDAEKFSRKMNLVLRAAALATSTQFKLKVSEEKHKGVEITAYRFDETEKVKADVNDIRFNFTPCFAQVDKKFVICSSVELCKQMIELLQAEDKSTTANSKKPIRDRYYASGFADVLKDQQDTLVTQAILDQAVTPAEAKKQVQALIDFVRGLGTLESGSTYLDNEFRYTFRTRTVK